MPPGMRETLYFKDDDSRLDVYKRQVWDREADPFSNQVKVYISVIRRKLQAVTDEEIIRSIRGAGYLIDKEEPL